MKGADWWRRLMEFMGPRYCVVCGKRLGVQEQSLCAACVLRLPRTDFLLEGDENPMVKMLWKLTPVSRALAFIHYEPRAESARIVYDMKYNDRPDTAEDMGRLMARELLPTAFFDGIDVVVPVPLTRRRQWQRGYNQSERLAAGIAEVTGLPVAAKALRRKQFLRSQTQLSRQERMDNVEGMFEVRDEAAVRGRHVLLVDDICTTGATLTACAAALSQVAGVTVSALTFGLTKS